MNNTRDELSFCVSCFATSEEGSWGGTSYNSYCTNCGSGGSAVRLPRWATDEIRRTASWVGKRYYPDKEDLELAAELKKLRLQLTTYPGRSVKPSAAGLFTVSQVTPTGVVGITIRATDQDEAFHLARGSLPYYSAEELAVS